MNISSKEYAIDQQDNQKNQEKNKASYNFLKYTSWLPLSFKNGRREEKRLETFKLVEREVVGHQAFTNDILNLKSPFYYSDCKLVDHFL